MKRTDELVGGEGVAYCSAYDSGSCGVKFSFFAPYGIYDVLSTDYTSYTIVYSCTPVLADAFNVEYLWVLTRDTYKMGSVEHEAFWEHVTSIITDKLPRYDLSQMRKTN